MRRTSTAMALSATALLFAGCSQTLGSVVPQPVAPMQVTQVERSYAETMLSADDPVCIRMKADYDVAMAHFAPKQKKKKGFMGNLGRGLLNVGTSVAGSRAIFSDGAAVIEAAGRTAEVAIDQQDQQDNVNTFMSATSIVQLNRDVVAEAKAKGCPLESLFPNEDE